MRTTKYIFVGLISVVILYGAVVLLISTDSRASEPIPGLEVILEKIPPGGKKPIQTNALTSTICDIPTTWWGVIPGLLRFIGAFSDPEGVPGAFCDRQTGMVLEASPSDHRFTWSEARLHCANLTVGDTGHKGWRLMSFAALAALVDTSSDGCALEPVDRVCLPDDHPFSNVLKGVGFWSATHSAIDDELAWTVEFSEGDVGVDDVDNRLHAWCGRGPMNADRY